MTVDLSDRFHAVANNVFSATLDLALRARLQRDPPTQSGTGGPGGGTPWSPADLFDALEAFTQPPANLGDPPIAADLDAHGLAHRVLAESLDCPFYLVGEEATAEEWDAMLNAPEGSLVLAIDPIDGSKPFEDLGFGYGTTLLAFERREPVDALIGAAVCNSSGLYLSISARSSSGLTSTADDIVAGRVGRRTPVSLLGVSTSLHEDGPASRFHRSVAIVGAKPGHRRLASTLFEPSPLDDLVVYNLGGAPAAVGLVLGRLGAVVCLTRQTMWDAAYLPIVASLGIPIFIITSNTLMRVRQSVVMEWFGRLSRESRGVDPVPPFVIARSEEFAGHLYRRLGGR